MGIYWLVSEVVAAVGIWRVVLDALVSPLYVAVSTVAYIRVSLPFVSTSTCTGQKTLGVGFWKTNTYQDSP
jgi:hypothetical protein